MNRRISRTSHPVGLAAIFAAGFALASLTGTSAASPLHRSGCHAVHSCPSDHHTYIWYDPSTGQGWDCAEPGAREYNPAQDTTTIVWEGLTYYCHAAGSSPPPTGPTTTTSTATTTTAGVQCGVERWAVKTLSDPGATSVNFNPVLSSVDALRALPAPSVSSSTPRISGVETTTYTVTARLVAMKLEDDHDIHLVIADPTSGGTMIVEFPDPQCAGAATSIRLSEIAAARASFMAAEGIPGASSFTSLSGTATITGVGFFDEIHGQTGVAPNGVELHPVLRFSTAAPSVTTTSATTTTTPTPNRSPTISSATFASAGHGRAGASYYVTEQIRFRVCDDKPGRLLAEVRETKVAGGQIRASGRRTKSLLLRSSCATNSMRWRVANKFRGVGYYTIALRVRDANGAWSRVKIHRAVTGA